MNKFRLFMMAAAVVFLAGCNVKKEKSQAVVDDEWWLTLQYTEFVVRARPCTRWNS